MSAKVVTIANRKGGVGKTTTAYNLAYGLTPFASVLLIDAEDQASLTRRFLRGPDLAKMDKGLDDVLAGKCSITDAIRDIPINQISSRLSLLPSSPSYLAANIDDIIRESKYGVGALKEAIKPVLDDYDYILVDCPTNLSRSGVACILAADHILVPIVPEYMVTEGLKNYLEILEKIPGDKAVHFFITMKQNNRLHKLIESSVRSVFGDRVLQTTIRKNVTVAESMASYETIFSYDPKSAGSKDYSALIEEIIKLLQ